MTEAHPRPLPIFILHSAEDISIRVIALTKQITVIFKELIEHLDRGSQMFRMVAPY